MIKYSKTDDNILALTIKGGYDDYELQEVHALMEEKLHQFSTLRMYLEITETADTEHAFKDLGLHMDLLKDFDRTALVTDAEAPASLAEHGDPLFACPIQGYSLQEREKAKAWISQN
ncbi:MAG: STAS/SEC14 domain-containing protein [Candidatus Sericytochromatia bacterium]